MVVSRGVVTILKQRKRKTVNFLSMERLGTKAKLLWKNRAVNLGFTSWVNSTEQCELLIGTCGPC